ncbi:sensor histidine kinase [Alkalihalobacillus oceani]|uniref:Sensor histidine kinase n=1 Tax=Halalkalibacter oceani TaxID=1653776 RepID=A0A9X2IN05_9BACI|nr:sensor histidine kinase [Halalkalibacter oceani]MCM3714454.1 sensor histidine kinase [Halalkalibacter oceani]
MRTFVNRWIGKMRLQTKMIVSVSLILLISSLITGYLSYLTHLSIAEKEISDQILQKVEQVSARIDLKLDELYRFSNSILFHPNVENLLSASNSGEGVSYNDIMTFDQVLNKMLLDNTDVYSVHIYNNAGQQYKPTHSYQFKELNRQLYQKVKNKLESTDGEMIWMSDNLTTYEGRNQDVIIATRKIKSNRLEDEGMLVIVLNVRSLFTILSELVVEESDTVYLYNGEHELIYKNTDKEMTGGSGNGSQLSTVFKEEVNGTRYLGATVQSEKTGFILSSHSSMAKLHEKSKMIFNVIVVSGIVSIFIAVLLILFTSHRLLRPIKRLLNGMRRVREGQLDYRIEVHSSDELSYIGNSFNSMTEHVSKLIEDVYEKQLMQREAELTALQAQLNPHFLYNTLDMLRSKLYLQDDYENADLIVSLSQMLRYSLEPASTRSTLKDEIKQIQNYLLLQKARYEEELEIKIDIDEEVQSCHILRLLLQPIVENAFVHGFYDQDEKRISIRGFKQEGHLIIEISDNGCGMKQETVARILGKNTSSMADTKKRIGIHNVIRRIELVYGEGSFLEIESEEGKGTKVRMTLPFEGDYHLVEKRDVS